MIEPEFQQNCSAMTQASSSYTDPLVIFLNGTSSAGKTTIAKALQEKAASPFLHIGIDTFLFMLPLQFLFEGKQASLGYEFIRVDDDAGPKVIVRTGYYGKKLNAVKRDTLKNLLQQKFTLIIDEVLFSDDEYVEYAKLLQAHKAYFISVKPPLHVCQERERQRGDRLIGLSRGVYEPTYQNKHYDLEIDSSAISPNDAAEEILDFIAKNPNPSAFTDCFSTVSL